MRQRDHDLICREDVLNEVMKTGNMRLVQAIEQIPAEHTEASEITVDAVIDGLEYMLSLAELDREIALKRVDREMYASAVRKIRVLNGALELIGPEDETEVEYDDDKPW